MNVLKLLIVLGGAILGSLGGVMAITNPGQQDYEEYATETLTVYLKEDGCNKVSHKLGGLLQSYCKTLVDTGKPQIENLISQSTKRHNYLLFSIYQTEISLPSPIPTYNFETIGAFQTFYTYESEQM